MTGDAGQFSFTLDPSIALTTSFYTEASWPLRAPMVVIQAPCIVCNIRPVAVYVCMYVGAVHTADCHRGTVHVCMYQGT